MAKYILDGAHMTSRAAAHDEIARALELPDYYGRNLDALWDCISAMEAYVTLINPAPMLNALGKYGCKLLGTMYEAAEENGNFQFTVE
ncbi:MAG: barstar family protein [Clostridia bacterium]|nr:barstar family protein [Clostridia bacterium]